MVYKDFLSSLDADTPPEKIDKELKALWWDAKGNWDKAHKIIQVMNNSLANWVHAYLHRKEGDLGNASFWYTNAGRKMPGVPLEDEWEEIVKAILDNEIRIENHFI